MAKIKTTVTVNEIDVPLDLYIEHRSSLRVAFGRASVIVRIPMGLSRHQQEKEYLKAKSWIIKKVEEKPYLGQQYTTDFLKAEEIRVLDKSYPVTVRKEERQTASGRIVNDGVYIKLPKGLSNRDESSLVKKLLSKIFAERHKREIIQRVLELNEQTLQQSVNAVRLKYNKSNWGSCSSDSNINLSTRLLLVPSEVRDYVIIHELCHLIEMNHSRQFWQLVERYCPDYRVYDKWLDTEGVKLDF